MIDHAPASSSRSPRDDAREHETDTLVALAAALAERSLEADPDPRFLEWQAAELRARRRPTAAAEHRADLRARRLASGALGAMSQPRRSD